MDTFIENITNGVYRIVCFTESITSYRTTQYSHACSRYIVVSVACIHVHCVYISHYYCLSHNLYSLRVKDFKCLECDMARVLIQYGMQNRLSVSVHFNGLSIYRGEGGGGGGIRNSQTSCSSLSY